jgi:hypothetical protein
MRNSGEWQLKARLGRDRKNEVMALARRRRLSISRLVETLLERELSAADAGSSSFPDESAIREMATLIAVEQILKLQEATIPGGITLSRRLVDEAAKAAVARLELIDRFLREEGDE